MNIRELTTESEIGAIEGSWTALWKGRDLPHIEQHPAWGALQAKENGCSFAVVALEEDGKPFALAPILVRPWKWRFRVGYKSIFAWPVTLADLCGDSFLAADNVETHEKVLMALSRSRLPFEMIYFESLAIGSPLYCAMTESVDVKRAFWSYAPAPPSPHRLIRFPETFDVYLSKFGGKTRRKLTNAVRKLEGECTHGIRIVRVTSQDDVPNFLEQVERLSKQSWQGTRLDQVVTSDANTRESFGARADKNWLRSYLLMNGEEPVAFVIGSQVAGTYYYERIGYDPKWTSFSPGKVLLFRVLEDLFRHDPPKVFDFGSGDSEYKQLFGNSEYEEVNLYLIRKTPSMAAARMLFESLKTVDSAGRRILSKTGLREKLRHILRGKPTKGSPAGDAPPPGDGESGAKNPAVE